MDINARQLDALDFNYLDQSETYQYNENQLVRAKGSAAIVAKLQEFITPWEQAKAAAVLEEVINRYDIKREGVTSSLNQ